MRCATRRARIDELLQRMRIAPRKKLVARLEELTAGNPLLLAELLSMGSPERVVSEWSSPPRVRDLARKRTAELGPRHGRDPQARVAVRTRLHRRPAGRDRRYQCRHDRGAHRSRGRGARPAAEHHPLLSIRPPTVPALTGRRCPRRRNGPTATGGSRRRSRRAPGIAALLAAHWSAASGTDVAAKVCTYARAAGRESLSILEPNGSHRMVRARACEPHKRGRSRLAARRAGRGAAVCGRSGLHRQPPRGGRYRARHAGRRIDAADRARHHPGWSTLPGVGSSETQRLLARALQIAATRRRAAAFSPALPSTSVCTMWPPPRMWPSSRWSSHARVGDRNGLLEALMRPRVHLTHAP